MKSWFFIADAHLSEDDQGRQQVLISFLEEHQDQMECLVILGDLFDFWFGFPGYVDPAYTSLYDKFRSLRQSGVRLIYLEGNHDFSLGQFFTEALQGDVYPREYVFQLDGKHVFLAHGDGLDPGDIRYRVYRRLLKNRAVYALIRFLGPSRVRKLKDFINRRKFMHRRRELPRDALPDERFAKEKCRKGIDVVILAHTHRPCEKTFVFNERTCRYYNVGDWLKHFSYLVYTPKSGFHLKYYRPEVLPPEKDREDRESLPEFLDQGSVHSVIRERIE